MEQSSSLESTIGREPVSASTPVPALKLKRPAENSNQGATMGLDIVRDNPKIPFTHSMLCTHDVMMKSEIVMKEGNGKVFKRVIMLTTLYGKVTVTIPKGRTIQSYYSAENHLDFFNARHIVVLTKEKRPWAWWWHTTSGRIVSLPDGEKITAFLKDLEKSLEVE